MLLFPKLLSGMTNSEDPDKNAPEGASDLDLHHLPLSETLVNKILGH